MTAPESPWCINRCGSRAVCEGRACGRCWQRCMRKARYATRELAWTEVERLRDGEAVNDPTLSIYKCKILTGHWHVGHASGRHGRRLVKRVEKARRKTLWKGAA